MFAWILLLAVVIAWYGIQSLFDVFVMAFAVAYPFLTVIQFWMYATSTDNKLLLEEPYYTMYEKKITSIIDPDTYSPIGLEHFINVDIVRNTYPLYISRHQFIYIPHSFFWE